MTDNTRRIYSRNIVFDTRTDTDTINLKPGDAKNLTLNEVQELNHAENIDIVVDNVSVVQLRPIAEYTNTMSIGGGGTGSGNLGGTVCQIRIDEVSGDLQTGLLVSNSVNNTNCTHVNFSNTNGLVGYISSYGSNTYYASVSDYRLKKDVVDFNGGLEAVLQMRPRRFKWISDDSDTVGFIADELQEVCPGAVIGEKDAVNPDGSPKYQAVDKSCLVTALVSAVKELEARVADLESRLN